VREKREIHYKHLQLEREIKTNYKNPQSALTRKWATSIGWRVLKKKNKTGSREENLKRILMGELPWKKTGPDEKTSWTRLSGVSLTGRRR